MVNDNILKIQEILEKVNGHEYEEAFLLSSQMIERSHSIEDALYHQWVKALTEFYTYNKKISAIELLEEVRPTALEKEIHFRIVNSLLCFYRNMQNKEKFLKCKNTLYLGLNNLENNELRLVILCNIANGFYTFKDYEEALEYTEEVLKIAKQYSILKLHFSLAIGIKIMCLFYLGNATQAKDLKKEFINYLKITDKLDHRKYLDEELKQFNKET